MTLIKCPNCGHSVLSVASKCPQCGWLLSEYRFIQGQEGALTLCRRCARKVLSGAKVCPYCGASHPGRRIPYAGVAVLAAVIPALLLAALYRQRLDSAPSPHLAPAQPAGLPRGTVQAEVAPMLTSPPRPAPAAHAQASSLPGGAVSSAATQTRWTLDWANVRQARALDAAVVRVIKPCVAVQVSDRVSGWWGVYLEGQFIGYIAGSLLGTSPPDSLQGGGRPAGGCD